MQQQIPAASTKLLAATFSAFEMVVRCLRLVVNAAEMNTPLPQILPFRHPGVGPWHGPWLVEASSSPLMPRHAGERGGGSSLATLAPVPEC